MDVVLAADRVSVTGLPSRPLSLHVDRREIVGLFFPPDAARAPWLRVLAGEELPRRGTVRWPAASHVVLVGPGASRTEAFANRPDLVILDGLFDVENPPSEGDAWAQLAAERERGTTILLATDRVEHAYRSDRVALAAWGAGETTEQLSRVSRRMQDMVADVLSLLAAPPGSVVDWERARELQRLTRASRELLREARALVRDSGARRALKEVGAQLVGLSIEDRVLESFIAMHEQAKWTAARPGTPLPKPVSAETRKIARQDDKNAKD